MKRAKKTFAVGQRVYPVGVELPDDHPVVTMAPSWFEVVPGSEEPKPTKSKKKGKADQGQKGAGGADGDA